MSLKSARSLMEECSEIIERSYSIRSASEESLSCSDEEECLARVLMHKLTPAMLSKLRRCFKKSKKRGTAGDIDRSVWLVVAGWKQRRKKRLRVSEVMRLAAAEQGVEFPERAPNTRDQLGLDEEGFVAAIDNIFGDHKYSPHAHKLYQLLDPFHTGVAQWSLLVDRLVAVGAKRTRSRAEEWVPLEEGKIIRLKQCKRELIVKLVPIESKDSFCYACVSRGGRVGLYSAEMTLLHNYEVFYDRTGVRRRVKNCWITDAVYLSDVAHLILSASDRSLTVYDAATLTHTIIYCITGLPSIVTCMSYSSSLLVLGSECGDVTLVRFLQPRVALFHTMDHEQISHYFWMELSSPPHTSYVSVARYPRTHPRAVRRVSFARDDVIISCALDNSVSVRCRHVPGKLDDYVFKVHRGVTCFHAVWSLHLLVTGSPCGAVRLWAPGQSAPHAALTPTHSAAVQDVAVIASRSIVLGFYSNCWLYIWDLHEECLLQSIRIRFPFLGIVGKKLEFGACCIHPGPPYKLPDKEDDSSSSMDGGMERDNEYTRFRNSSLIITCGDVICHLTLSSPRGRPLPPPRRVAGDRRPSCWDLPEDAFQVSAPTSPSTPLSCNPSSSNPSEPHKLSASQFLSPSTSDLDKELDTLLKNAGLEGILEKDFVLARSLKHDLNQKLARMHESMHAMMSAVSAGAPYLGLRLSLVKPLTQNPANDMMEEYKRVQKLFPPPSVTNTPGGSVSSSPRRTTPRKKTSVASNR